MARDVAYQQAEEKIERASRLRVNRLELAELGLTELPQSLGQLTQLKSLDLRRNQLTVLPDSLGQLTHLQVLLLYDNPLDLELTAAYKEGLKTVQQYLRAKSRPQVVLNEGKLILVGEGEVGKSCLLSALREDKWIEKRPTTHGIEIKPVKVTNPDTGTEITLNGWDFGGQRVYRPTHQLFLATIPLRQVI